MHITLLIVLSLYCIYLNLRLKQVQEDLDTLMIDFTELNIKLYNKMMEIRKEIKESIKPKRIEKSRRRSAKRRSKVPKNEVS